ncbi:MAG: S41 family peptidase [Oscillospiraceae bacterium]
MKDKIKNALQSFFGIKIRFWAVIMACVLFCGLGWGINARSQTRRFGGREGYAAAQKYLEVKKILSDNFVGEEDEQAMSDAACAAMVKALGDRWSYYMSPSEYESYKLYSANQYEGIGVTITVDEASGGFAITAVEPGSPAESAELAVGDIITAVDAEPLSGKTVTEVRTLIRSHMDETVTLTVKGANVTGDVKVDCTVIYKQPVTYKLTDDKVGYIRIQNFDAGAGEKAVAAVDELLAKGAVAMVFDVRTNPGGMLSELIKILDHLLPEGDIFVSVNEAGEETVTKSDNVCIDVPMAVLVDKNTYSAAEFFAAALKEYNWATVVGEQTTGKARSQVTFELPDGSAVHLSNNKYLTPDRVDLALVGGLTPDILAATAATAEKDEALTSAVNAVLGKS